MKTTNNLGLSEEDVSELFYGGMVFEDPDTEEVELYEHVTKKVVDTDSEKGRVTYEVVIKHIPTKKLYKATLSNSPWYMQSEANAGQDWTEVKPKTKKVTVYE